VASIDPVAEEPKVKGALVREMLLWYGGRFGHEATARLAARVPPALAPLIDPSLPALGILASSWYPVSLTHPMLDAAMEGQHDEGRELAREANRDVVPRLIRGVYRIAFRATASPELYARHVGRLWRRLHTTGDRSMVLRAPGEAFSVVESWAGHHPFVCWMTIYTMAYVFEAMGYKRWTVDRLACVGHGAARCETVLRFAK
jgi:hypothetical protein